MSLSGFGKVRFVPRKENLPLGKSDLRMVTVQVRTEPRRAPPVWDKVVVKVGKEWDIRIKRRHGRTEGSGKIDWIA